MAAPYEDAQGELSSFGVLLFFIGLLIPNAPLSVAQWTLITTRGQSLAKIVLGTRIIRVGGEPCGFVHGVLIRSWLLNAVWGGVSTMTLGLLGWTVSVRDGALIYGDRRQTLHDLMAGTIVVEAGASARPPTSAGQRTPGRDAEVAPLSGTDVG